MIPKLVSELNEIAAKPNASPGTLLIVTRRTCRILVSIRDDIGRQRREFLRTAIKARRDLPQSASDIEMLEDLAVTHRRDELEYARARLIEFGRLMSSDGSGLAQRLGFDRMCDILNVNPVHRTDIRPERRSTFNGLIFEARVEDSADVKNELWASGGPLCEAFYAAYLDELLQKSLREIEQQNARQAANRQALAQLPASPTIH
jgi:hypothetical protein